LGGLTAAPPQSAMAASVHSAPSCLVTTPPEGSSIPVASMKLPLRERDALGSLYDTQGWLTSPDELDVDAETNGAWHQANDLELVRQPDHGYGLPILAAADGRAYYSYEYRSGSWTDANGTVHQVGWGGGLFVEVRHSVKQGGKAVPTGWVSQYIHLSGVASGIPYLRPTAVPDLNDPDHPDWTPSVIRQSDDVMWSLGVPVRQGQVIGYMGDTGVGLDWKDDFNPDTGIVTPRNRVLLPAWDPPQLHFQLYQGRINGAKQNIVDPFGWYAQVCPGEWQPFQPHVNPYGYLPGFMRATKNSAWVTDRFGHLEYAAP